MLECFSSTYLLSGVINIQPNPLLTPQYFETVSVLFCPRPLLLLAHPLNLEKIMLSILLKVSALATVE